MKEVICPICASNSYKFTSHMPYSYYKCNNCFSAFLYPFPEENDLKKFYEKFHLSINNGGIFEEFEERINRDFPAKARIVQNYLSNYGNFNENQFKVLDVGCGKGFFVKKLNELGILAEGIVISKTAIDIGTREYCIKNLRAGKLEDQKDWDKKFHAITTWATIEHTKAPKDFLLSFHNVLVPKGFLFLDTGLANDFIDKLAPGLVQWYDPPQHTFVFSFKGIKILLEESGFEIIDYNLNFERNFLRKIIKYTRNHFLVLSTWALFKISLGSEAFQRMKREAKMPFGSLLFIIARARY